MSVSNYQSYSFSLYELMTLPFWSPGSDYAYGRWIMKKRGQKPKKSSQYFDKNFLGPSYPFRQNKESVWVVKYEDKFK